MAAKARAAKNKKKAVKKAWKLSGEELREQVAIMAAGAARYPIDLDFRFDRFVFSGHGEGGGDPKNDSFSIVAHGTIREHCYPLGAIRFNRKRWKKFRKLGNGLLKSLSVPAKNRRKKK